MTGLARLYGHLGVIEPRGRPTGCFGAYTRCMAVLAQVGRGHVSALFAHRLRAIVTTHAATGDPGVIEVGPEPVGGQMAITTLEIGGYVIGGLAGGLHTVVADDAESGDGHRYLSVVNGLRGIPAEDRVAGLAFIAGRDVSVWVLALSERAVMAGDARAQRLHVLEVHVGTEGNRVMAGGAVVRARNVRRILRRCVVLGAGYVTGAAIPGRPLEDRVQVALFAGQIAMHAIELEPRGQVIERHGDRRRAGSRKARRRHQRQ